MLWYARLGHGLGLDFVFPPFVLLASWHCNCPSQCNLWQTGSAAEVVSWREHMLVEGG